MNDFHVFMPIAKMDVERRTVSGYASTPAKDSDGEIVTLEAIRKALPGYMKWGNIREMHKLSAVGSAQEGNIDNKGLYLTAKIVDDQAWQKCKEGVYKGFSIGGRKLSKSGNKITEIDMTEISVVDRPANPECSFALAKREKDLEIDHAEGYLIKIKEKPELSPEAKALAKMAKVVGSLAKAGPPAAHDGFSLPAKVPSKNPDGTVSVNDSRPEENVTRKTDDDQVPCEAHGKIGCEKCAAAKKQKLGESNRPYGDVEYADPGHRPDGKKRYPIDTVDHIRAAWNYIHKKKNAAKYTTEDLAKVKAKIVAAWKAHVHKEGPPSMDEASKAETLPDVDKLFKLASGSFLTLNKSESQAEPEEEEEIELENDPFVLTKKTKSSVSLEKSMRTAGSMSYIFDSLRDAQRNLLMEGKREGGDKRDKKLADRIGAIAKELSAVIGQKATHEGEEATTLSDADDMYVNRILGDKTMTDTMNYAEGSDPLSKAILDVVKRAAEPTKAQRMEEAMKNVKECRKASKAAREALEDCHKMHKAAFLSKAAKAAKGEKGAKDNGDDEFDHAGAMEKLQKAYQEIEKSRTFGKAAMAQITKAAARSGQRGQEANDPESPFYEVPSGVKDLTPAMMATLGPAGGMKGSDPMDYKGDGSVLKRGEEGGDLAKFAKNGVISLEMAQLLLEKAQTDGELAALKRLPLHAANGRRPMAFDTSRLLGGTGGGNNMPGQGDLNKALFDGVDVGAMNGQDERAHTEASARAIGNFLTSGHFGKSVFDPAFAGGVIGTRDK